MKETALKSAESAILEKSDQQIESIREVSRALDMKLAEIESKNHSIEELFKQVELMKDMRIKLDSELTMLAQKREKVDKLEDQLQMILSLKDQIEEKASDLNKIQKHIDSVMNDFVTIDKQKNQLEAVIDEFNQKQELLANTIQTIQRQSDDATSLEDQLGTIANLVERLDGKTNNMRSDVESVQHQLISLQRHESEIKEIQGRFSQIEDLIEDIDRRKNQIDILRKRFEELRQSMSNSVLEIEKIEHDAEGKVKKLSEFINAVDMPQAPITKTMGVATGVGDKKQLVMTLGQMGWSAEEIADRINMDVSAIETILSTFNH